LAQLHGNGLVYGDISPDNVYVSKDIIYSEVWFIDADNLRFEVETEGRSVYTPKYGAPELVQGLDIGRPATDCHAFAVMAFYLLSMIHPFIGKMVEDGGETDWANDEFDDVDLDEQAYAGFLPWVDDHKDDINSTLSGLPRSLILTEKLATLFQKTFSDGRTCSWRRPSIYHWPEALAEAADKTITCPSCNMSWFFDIAGDRCPYCAFEKPKFILFQSYRWVGEKDLDSPCWLFVREMPALDTPLTLPERLFKSFSIKESDNLFLQLFFDDHHILLKKLEKCNVNLTIALTGENDGIFKELISQIQLPTSALDTGFWMHAEGDEPRLIKCSFLEVAK